MHDLARRFALFVVLSALLTQPCYAEQFPESERQKTDERATDEAYKAVTKHTPNSNKKIDPWAYERLRKTPVSKVPPINIFHSSLEKAEPSKAPSVPQRIFF
jgi:hypothetical protein